MRNTQQRRSSTPKPSLRFSPYAWSKFLFLRDQGETEIGGFALSAAGDPLLVEDILLVRQYCTVVTVAFDDDAIADYFDQMVDTGVPPERFARIWLHTHPGNSPLPSTIDEATFGRVFNRADWSVMAIVARNDASYARLQFRAGPGGGWRIPVRVDFQQPFAASDPEAWRDTYQRHVILDSPALPSSAPAAFIPACPADWPYTHWEWEEFQHDELTLAPL